MVTNPFFSGRIPQGLYDRIEEYREQTAETKSEILVRALAQYVDYPLGEEEAPPPIKQTFEEIFSRLAALESKIANENRLSQLSTDNTKQLSDDNMVITENNAADLQLNNTRQYTNTEVAEIIGRDRSTVGKAGRKIRRKEPTEKSVVAREIKEAGFRPSETHEHCWIKVK